MKAKPTVQQYTSYQGAYDYFNKTLFADRMKPCILVLGRSAKSRGHFAPDLWSSKDGGTVHEISLNPDLLEQPFEETMSTLVHEMCHQWQWDYGTRPRRGYHDREWVTIMMERGLVPSSTGQPGGKQTGQKITHYIQDGGKFAVMMTGMPKAAQLPWLADPIEDGKRKSANLVKKKLKYLCPACRRVAVWGKAGLQILCMLCDKQMQTPDMMDDDGGEED
jgi:hypothetical protein